MPDNVWCAFVPNLVPERILATCSTGLDAGVLTLRYFLDFARSLEPTEVRTNVEIHNI